MRTSIPELVTWRHDLAGCLHACAATLLEFHGVDALEALGAGWGFYHRPGGLERAEYYFPCRPGVSLLATLAPHHPVRSAWRRPADAARGWAEVRDAVAAGRPVAVAVDNFELPFRPAFQDVHSNHLVVVHGFDEARGTVEVIDTVPPAFAGEIPLERLSASRDSGNEVRHDRDMFFTAHPIGNRWLDVEVDTAALPEFDAGFVRAAIVSNVDDFGNSPAGEGEYAGLAGQRRYLAEVVERYARGDEVCDELFVVAGAALAVVALHADWLALAGRRLAVPDLREAGRAADRIAHHWTALRILAARTRDGTTSAEQLTRRHTALLLDQERLLDELTRVTARL
ncbi:BtrH N-terminal domain-containing protein [Actinosynnema sp. NPDC020468]|uniref:BtrH N-terminal domain-containing protein n=1 Tax=Actinosynnema sp. NPDC020468 TaxID=3154488 RepID=UPI003407A41E